MPALARWARLARLPWRRVLTRRQAHYVCVRLLIVVIGVSVLSCIGPAGYHKIRESESHHIAQRSLAIPARLQQSTSTDSNHRRAHSIKETEREANMISILVQYLEYTVFAGSLKALLG